MFIAQLLQYLKARKLWKEYQHEKELSKVETGQPPRLKEKINNFLYAIICCTKRREHAQPKGCRRMCYRGWTEGTFEHFVRNSLVFYVIGLCISGVMLYPLMGFPFKFLFFVSLPTFVMFTVAFVFSRHFRCMLILGLPELCSKKGQQILSAYVILLVLAGPVANMYHNMKIVKESGSCQQASLADGAEEIADILFGPFTTYKQAVKYVADQVRELVKKMQAMLAAFKAMVVGLADAIQGATKWINSKINGCKTSVGTTYQHCMNAFSKMYEECKVNVPAALVKMCLITDFASNLCSSVKPADLLCDLVSFTVDPLITTINQRISRLWDRAYTLFYFSLNVKRGFEMGGEVKFSKDDLKQKIINTVTTVKQTVKLLITYNFIDYLLILYFGCKVYRYWSKYKRWESFDNCYITQQLKEMEISRLKQVGKTLPTIFPLRRNEQKKFIYVTSLNLSKQEKIKMISPIFDCCLITIKTIVLIVVDYSLYWVIDKCRYFMYVLLQSVGTETSIVIEGSGFIADLSRRVMGALNHMDYNFYYSHFMPCMPNPTRPSTSRNIRIGFILAIIWFTAIMRPFVLRFRHSVMDYYFPEMAQRRAVWLYNHILYKRTNFIEITRRKLKAKLLGKEDTTDTTSYLEKLRTECPWLRWIIGRGKTAKGCVVCGYTGKALYTCPDGKCSGILCDECYVASKGICYFCKEDMMQTDLSWKKSPPSSPEQTVEKEVDEHLTDEEDFLREDDSHSDDALDFSYQAKGRVAQHIPLQAIKQKNKKKESLKSMMKVSGKNPVNYALYEKMDENYFRRLREAEEGQASDFEGGEYYEDMFEMF